VKKGLKFYKKSYNILAFLYRFIELSTTVIAKPTRGFAYFFSGTFVEFIGAKTSYLISFTV
jgi:hypothetical protein